eukprot:SAG22_NODE_1064_length_5756_cov_48.259502_7_plen_62_part_00
MHLLGVGAVGGALGSVQPASSPSLGRRYRLQRLVLPGQERQCQWNRRERQRNTRKGSDHCL